MKKHRLLLIVAVGVILAGGLTAYISLQKSRQVPTDPAWQGLDSGLRQSAASGTFSGTVLVVKGGQPLLLKGYGWADKNHNVANTLDTKFCIASMGKMFTAVAIAQLVQQGKLSFDDSGQPVPPEPRQGTGNAANLRDNSQELQVGNPSGGAYSTVRDILNFATALTAHKLLNAEMTNTILTGKVDSHRPGGPASDKYAYGFADIRLNGVRIVGHNGGTPGYEAQLDVYPDRGYVVVVLTNQDGVMNPLIRKIEEMLTAK